MLFYLDMRQIKITEQQLKNIIVGEGFSFEPYYVKNKDGNTVKRQKMVYRPNLNTQSKKDAINDFNQNNLTNSFSIKLTKEMLKYMQNNHVAYSTKNYLIVNWEYKQNNGELLFTIKIDGYKPFIYHRIYIPYNSQLKKFYYDNNSKQFIVRFIQPSNSNSFNKDGVIKLSFEDVLNKKLDNNQMAILNKNKGIDSSGYADTRFFNDNQNNKTLDNIKSNVVTLEKSQVKCINLFNFNLASTETNSVGDKAFKPMKHSVRKIDTHSANPHRTNEPSFIRQKGTEPIVQDKSMQIFYNKIITYLAWYVIKNNINTIIVPQSSSSLTTDIINKTKLKIPNGNLIYSFNDLIVKNYNGLKIDMNKAKENNLNNDEIQDLQYRVNLANKKGMYNIKTFSGKERNVLNNLFTINSKYQNYITKVITNKNVLVFDDNYSTGVTLDETCLQLQQYNPKSIVAITIEEIRKPKQSVRF